MSSCNLCSFVSGIFHSAHVVIIYHRWPLACIAVIMLHEYVTILFVAAVD